MKSVNRHTPTIVQSGWERLGLCASQVMASRTASWSRLIRGALLGILLGTIIACTNDKDSDNESKALEASPRAVGALDKSVGASTIAPDEPKASKQDESQPSIQAQPEPPATGKGDQTVDDASPKDVKTDLSESVQETPQSRARARIESAQEKIKSQDWEGARQELQRALEIDPTNQLALLLIKRVELEASAKQNVNQARNASSSNDAVALEEAIGLLSQVPRDSVYYAEAQQQLLVLNKRLAETMTKDASDYIRSKQYEKAHRLLCDSLRLDPSDTTTVEMLVQVEEKLKQSRVDFKPCKLVE